MDDHTKEGDHAGALTHDVDLLCDVAQRYNVGLTWLECRVMIQGIYSDALRIKRKRQHAAVGVGRKTTRKAY